MDAVELPLPAVSNLMGSEGFAAVRPTIDTCTSFLPQRDEGCDVNDSEPAFWNNIPNVELRGRDRQLFSFHNEDAPKDVNIGNTSDSILLVPTLDAKSLQRKSGKVARSNGGFSKRPRIPQMEVSIFKAGAGDINGISKELGSSPAKCNFAEKTQITKQKNNLNGKRGDKRNGKVSKSKCDSFSLKAGLVSFSSAAGGNISLGVYGSKPDIYDLTKHVDELSLNGLLDGSHKCPSFTKDKGKKVANLNENILHSVREACSILRLQKPIQPQNFAGIDDTYNQKVSTCLVGTHSSLASRNDSDKGDTYNKDPSLCNKDSCIKLKTPANILDLPSYQPKIILERLALPPPKDLEFMLLDTAKPSVPSKGNPDPRLCKPPSNRGGLPPFSWSHTSGGHCRSNSDAVKLSTNRSTCQGRWVRIGNPATFLGPTDRFLSELESLKYDQSLVPSGGPKPGPSESENAPSTSVSFASFERVSSSSAAHSIVSSFPSVTAGHSPRLLAAAQTLYDIATQPLKQSPNGMIRWPKKPSQKAMKACKLKSNEKSEKRPDSPFNSAAEMMTPSKKLKLSVDEKNNDLTQSNITMKGPMHWSTTRSSRSSPSKLLKDSVGETRHHNANIVKKSCMMPPPARVLDKAYNSQPKMRKIMPMEWSRASGKLD